MIHVQTPKGENLTAFMFANRIVWLCKSNTHPLHNIRKHTPSGLQRTIVHIKQFDPQYLLK